MPAAAARVGRPLLAPGLRGEVDLEPRRAGHRDVLVEGRLHLDLLAEPVGLGCVVAVHVEGRRRGNLDARHLGRRLGVDADQQGVGARLPRTRGGDVLGVTIVGHAPPGLSSRILVVKSRRSDGPGSSHGHKVLGIGAQRCVGGCGEREIACAVRRRMSQGGDHRGGGAAGYSCDDLYNRGRIRCRTELQLDTAEVGCGTASREPLRALPYRRTKTRTAYLPDIAHQHVAGCGRSTEQQGEGRGEEAGGARPEDGTGPPPAGPRVRSTYRRPAKTPPCPRRRAVC